jgi:hypothetical protein
MTEDIKWKILQIIPAQAGWKAVHCETSNNAEIKVSHRAIVCWALVEPVGESAAAQAQVRGIEQKSNDLTVVDDVIGTDKVENDGADGNQYFLGYNDPEAHKESDFWIKQGVDRFRAEGERRLTKPRGQAGLRAAHRDIQAGSLVAAQPLSGADL